MMSPHSCLYLLLIVLAVFLFLTLALLLVRWPALFCFINRHLRRSHSFNECLFAGAECVASAALLSPSQGRDLHSAHNSGLTEACSSKMIRCFKPSHKSFVFPALTSFLPSLTFTQRPFQSDPTGVTVISRLCLLQCQKFLETGE